MIPLSSTAPEDVRLSAMSRHASPDILGDSIETCLINEVLAPQFCCLVLAASFVGRLCAMVQARAYRFCGTFRLGKWPPAEGYREDGASSHCSVPWRRSLERPAHAHGPQAA